MAWYSRTRVAFPVRRERLWWLPLALFATGCGPTRTPYPEALQSERPDERIRAIKQAVQLRDESVLGILVDRLEDSDEAVRFYAILALEKLTGTRMGYEYHAPEPLRGRAVQRWRAYLARSGAGDSARQEGPDL